MSTPMGQRAYARHRGVALRAVQKAIASGRIPVDANGKIDPIAADAAWEENTNPIQRARGDHGAKDRPNQSTPVPTPPEASGAPSMAKAQAVRMAYQAKLAQLQYEREIKKVVNAEEVKTAMQQIIASSKTKLLALASKAKSRLPHLTSADVQQIDDLVRETLEDLSGAEL